ncbi:sRNA-binding protein [Plasticicumulans lactativorans]|uniref:SRNA-binding protein n=1 Tax=Plasticicumulans lactativorans TaxID=1133106 RepID=A0A4V2SD58_9GAMM|nr:ProQ/FinO family protein [Plasticicumulans lactativorans]TCO82026.1 sRNA-binding protein [Plasticicumulans lactativorans]
MLEESPAPVPEASKPSAREQSRSLLDRLIATYPKAFFPLSARQVRPLKLGVHKDLQPVIKEWGYDNLALRLALGLYIRALRYQVALTKEASRVDLAGEATGEISEEHRAKAREQVEALRAKRQERAQVGKAASAPAATPPAAAETAEAEAAAPSPRRARRERPARDAEARERPARARKAPREENQGMPPRRPRSERSGGERPAPAKLSAAPTEEIESAMAAALREALQKKGDGR